MALIKYPDTDWNTFVEVLDAEVIISEMADSTGKDLWTQLDQQGKENILRQTALQIRLCPNITLPDEVTSDLELAQCYLTTHALAVDTISYDPTEKAVTYEKVGSLATAYQAGMKGSNSDFDTMTSSLLKQYGCSGQSSGFSQSTVARV